MGLACGSGNTGVDDGTPDARDDQGAADPGGWDRDPGADNHLDTGILDTGGWDNGGRDMDQPGDPGIPDGTAGDPGSDDSPDTWGWCSDAGETPAFLTLLETAGDFALMQRIDQPGIKFLARKDGIQPPDGIEDDCLFQDMHRWELHLLFLRANIPGMAELDMNTYANWVLRSGSRSLWGGDVRLWPGVAHPLTGVPGVASLAVMSDTTEGLTLDELEEVHGRIAACMPFAGSLLVLVPSHAAQQASMVDSQAALAARGIGILFPGQLADGVAAQTYSQGVAHGILRVDGGGISVPPGPDRNGYDPRDQATQGSQGPLPDIPAKSTAPDTFDGLAGLLTEEAQEPDSVLNLYFRDREMPSASVSGLLGNALVRTFHGQAVRVIAAPGRLHLSPVACPDAFF